MSRGQFMVQLREAIGKFSDGVREYDASANPSVDTGDKREKFYGALALGSARDSEILIEEIGNAVVDAIIKLRGNYGSGLLSLDDSIAFELAWDYYDKYERAKELAKLRPGQIA